MKTKLSRIILAIFIGLPISVVAQHIHTKKCATMEVHKKNLEKDPEIMGRRQLIEAYTKQFIENENQQRGARQVYTIPVVFHVVHYGEAIGVGTNISEAQILTQLNVLNNDFRLRNSDSLLPSHPFWGYTADTEIEFCLAKKDPFGNQTNGITRYSDGTTPWTVEDFDDYAKPATHWPSSAYLNIWIVEFDPAEDLLGYAQFPGENPVTDGVVMNYKAFGTIGSATYPNDLGRTATHEVGHWLNLLHIWGDTICGDDEINDTPVHEDANYGCFTFPYNPNSSCPGSDANGEMFMNYMDYVDDDCMNMFTFGQSARMRAALTGPRASLLNSNACTYVASVNESTISPFAVNFYPNPASTSLTIEFADSQIGEVSISLLNQLGQHVGNYNNINPTVKNITIDVSNLPEAFYFAKITNGTNEITKKIIINR